MENLGFLFAAYTVIWAIVFGYVLFMQRKQRRLQRQIDLLQKPGISKQEMIGK
jgi:CcmD family protein